MHINNAGTIMTQKEYQINGRFTSQLSIQKAQLFSAKSRFKNVLLRATTKILPFLNLLEASCQIHAENCFKVCYLLSNSLISKVFPELFDC